MLLIPDRCLRPISGTTLLIGGAVFLIMFVAGASPKFLGPLVIVGVAGLLVIAWHISERQGRLLAFLHPDQYQEKEGHQQWMGLIAFGSGGVEGLGLGNGRQKMLYLPYAHTDFIFPVIGEELGLRVTLVDRVLLPFDCNLRHSDFAKRQRQIWHVAGIWLHSHPGLASRDQYRCDDFNVAE